MSSVPLRQLKRIRVEQPYRDAPGSAALVIAFSMPEDVMVEMISVMSHQFAEPVPTLVDLRSHKALLVADAADLCDLPSSIVAH